MPFGGDVRPGWFGAKDDIAFHVACGHRIVVSTLKGDENVLTGRMGIEARR